KRSTQIIVQQINTIPITFDQLSRISKVRKIFRVLSPVTAAPSQTKIGNRSTNIDWSVLFSKNSEVKIPISTDTKLSVILKLFKQRSMVNDSLMANTFLEKLEVIIAPI